MLDKKELLSINILNYINCLLQVYLCHIKPALVTPLPANIFEEVGIAKVLPDSVILQDGQQLQVDTIIMCTGYEYGFPFLSPQCEVQVTRGRVTPLYKHIIHAKYPTLSFMAVPYKVAPFRMFYFQANYISSLLDGNMTLPSEEDMHDDIEKDFAHRITCGIPAWHAHYLGDWQWSYYEELERLGKFNLQIPPVKTMIWNRVFELKDNDYMNYKKKTYEILDANSFVESNL